MKNKLLTYFFGKPHSDPGTSTLSTIVAALLLFPLLSAGQVTVEWSNAPGGVSVATDQLHQVYSADWEYNPGGDITVTKRTSGGSILWSAAYDNIDNTRHEAASWIETDSQNNCVVSGTIRSGFSQPVNAASLLMKFDAAGNLLWRNVFESDFEGSYTTKILIDDADNIYVLGLGMSSSGLVTRVKKFDSNGATIWTYYDTDGVGAPRNFKFTPDNAIVVSARGITGIINGYFKLSTDGNLIWSISGITSPTVGDAVGDAFGNTYIINGENVISNAGSILGKYNPNGILIWAHTNSMAGSKVEVGTDNNPVISGFPSAGLAGAAFMKYDSSGSVIWQNPDADGPALLLLLHGQLKLDAANNAYLSAGNLTEMAVCKINADGTNGWVGLVSGSSFAQSFTIDSDNSVYLIGGTTAKLSQTNLIVNTFANVGFMVAPNPFSNHFTISTNNDAGKNISLYSINGTLVYKGIFNGPTEDVTPFNIGSGMYILVIENQSGVLHTQKIIKQNTTGNY